MLLIPKHKHPRVLPFPYVSIEMDGIEGWTSLDFCSKSLTANSKVFVMWKRPTTAHYFSRLYIHCPDCVRRIVAKGMPDCFHGTIDRELPCGAMVVGHWNQENGILRPDYFPIESPRLFGLLMHGGAMRKHYEEFDAQV